MHWQRRFLNDELWLRSRRVLFARLRDAGFDSDVETYRRFAERQHHAGSLLVGGLSRWLGGDRAVEMGRETFLGAGHRRFVARLPFILAFMAEYVDWLKLVAPGDPARQITAGELAALFNLGIVVVDQIADAPSERGDLQEVFGAGRIERLMRNPADAEELGRMAAALQTPELRVLAAIVSAFFHGIAALTAERPHHAVTATLMDTIAKAYIGQIAAAGGDGSEGVLRAKSVLPFVVPPALVLLTADVSEDDDLLELGETVGEVFWRVDDLMDVARDYFQGDGNLVLVRAGVAGERGDAGLSALLDDGCIERVGAEVAAYACEALDRVGRTGRGRREAAQWLEMYALDWMR